MEYWTVFDARGVDYMTDVLNTFKTEAEYEAANEIPEVMSFGGGKVTKVFVETTDYRTLCKSLVEALEEINDANQVNNLGSDGECCARDVSAKALALFAKISPDTTEDDDADS